MADSGFGLSAQEYYYWAEGLANLVPAPDPPQNFLGNYNENGFNGGVNTGLNRLTSTGGGSWGMTPPVSGSLVFVGGTVVQVVSIVNSATIQYATASGSNTEIQAAFEYPNVFDIDVYDSAVEAYCGNTDAVENNGTYFRGVQLLVSGGSAGMYLLSRVGGTAIPVSGTITPSVAPVGSTLTANNGAALQVTNAFGSGNGVVTSVITGTPEQIQTGFQWPNHFTVTPP